LGAYTWYQEQQEREAQGLLVKAYSAMWGDAPSVQRNPDEAKKVLRGDCSQVRRTVAAEEALIRLGNCRFDGNKSDEAVGTYGII